MWGRLNRSAAVVAMGSVAACTNLNFVHDPQLGAMDRAQLPGFIKSLRCELKTFVGANAERRRLHEANLVSQARPATSYSFFPLDPRLFGGVYLDLKIIDTAGIGVGDVNITQRSVVDASHSRSWIFAPTLGAQNTYSLNYSLIIDQSTGPVLGLSSDPFRCYDVKLMSPAATFEALANDTVPGAARFTRILVNAGQPLAAWLRDNGNTLWVNLRAEDAVSEQEQIVPVQMSYTFQVQVAGGLTVRYSLTSPVYSPAQVGAGAGAVHTSQVQIFLNGYNAGLGPTAKIGAAKNEDPGRWAGLPPRRAAQLNAELKAVGEQRTLAETQLKGVLERSGVKMETLRPLTADERGPAGSEADTLSSEIERLRRRERVLRNELSAPAVRSSPARDRGRVLFPIGVAVPQ